MSHDEQGSAPRGRPLPIRGRGAAENPPNRFEPLHVELEEGADQGEPRPETRLLRDSSRSAITRNRSPDVGFGASLNPYRGCSHGCAYCYARPTHEYLGFSAGLDFETRILVKEDAARLLREELASPDWEPEVLVMSGVTDPYQPVERRLGITRECLQVLSEFGNPVSVITKNHMVTRDADILAGLAARGAAQVTLSVTTLRNDLQRVMEPRTSIPARRLRAVRELSRAGVPVGVNVAPVIPGLTDHELPSILEAARDAGAVTAGYVLLRLPHGVADLFDAWLERHFPDRREKVLARLRSLRGGRLNDPRFGTRMRGEGPFADQIRDLFRVTAARLGLDGDRPPLSTAAFHRPHGPGGQTELTL